MKLPHKYETTKLHYGKYLYKLNIYSTLASIFRTEFQRDGKLGYAAKLLNDYNAQNALGAKVIKKGRFNETHITTETLQDANHIWKTLRYGKDYTVRCEINQLFVYSNNLKFLERLYKDLNTKVELWEPNPENIKLLQENKNIILVDKEPEFKYKITFGRKRSKPELASWLKQNSDKSRAGSTFISNCENSNWIQGQYVFVRDEKVIFLINMIAGDNITKIEELVYR